LTKELERWLDGNENLRGDVVKIVGSMRKEQKFHNTNVFTGPDEQHQNQFRPRILVATNCAKEGINDANVRLVVHDDFPRSVEEYLQVIGRAGRRADSSPSTDSCHLYFDLDAYVEIVSSIYAVEDPKKATAVRAAMSVGQYQQFQMGDFKQVLQLVTVCWRESLSKIGRNSGSKRGWETSTARMSDVSTARVAKSSTMSLLQSGRPRNVGMIPVAAASDGPPPRPPVAGGAFSILSFVLEIAAGAHLPFGNPRAKLFFGMFREACKIEEVTGWLNNNWFGFVGEFVAARKASLST
jgi:hypothetical protein